jgi:hypothetical protein
MRVEVSRGSVVLEFLLHPRKKEERIQESADLSFNFLFQIVFVCDQVTDVCLAKDTTL